jgi:PHD/YefM family antitoxin component YafN of YafNO toxin-antitoxin module
MPTTVSGRQFNHDTSGAKIAALSRSVFITESGKPAHVLLSIEEYQRLTSTQISIIDILAMPNDEDLKFEAPWTCNRTTHS